MVRVCICFFLFHLLVCLPGLEWCLSVSVSVLCLCVCVCVHSLARCMLRVYVRRCMSVCVHATAYMTTAYTSTFTLESIQGCVEMCMQTYKYVFCWVFEAHVFTCVSVCACVCLYCNCMYMYVYCNCRNHWHVCTHKHWRQAKVEILIKALGNAVWWYMLTYTDVCWQAKAEMLIKALGNEALSN